MCQPQFPCAVQSSPNYTEFFPNMFLFADRYMHILKVTGCSNIPWAQNQIIAHCSGKRHKVMYSWRSGDMISKPYRQSIRPLTLHRGRHRYVDPTFQPYRRIMTLESLEVEISPQEFFSPHEISRLEDET